MYANFWRNISEMKNVKNLLFENYPFIESLEERQWWNNYPETFEKGANTHYSFLGTNLKDVIFYPTRDM